MAENQDNDARNKLIYSVMKYLSEISEQKPDGVDLESLEVGLQCLNEAFGVDITSEEHKAKYAVSSSLPVIFKAGLGIEKLQSSDTPLGSLVKRAMDAMSGNPAPVEKTDEEIFEEKFQKYLTTLTDKGYFANCDQGSDEYNQRLEKARERLQAQEKIELESRNQQAEAKKQEGNELLQQKKTDEAIEAYSEAIRLNPNNAIYYANRAAAYSNQRRHDKAIEDCHSALRCDENYVKAYSRLGLAHFSLSQFRQSVAAYKRAAELEPDNDTIQKSLVIAEKKLAEKGDSVAEHTCAHGHSHEGHGHSHEGHNHSHHPHSHGGAPGGGGMPDLSGLLQNPAIQNMMSSFQNQMGQNSSGGPPNISEMMNDPRLHEQAAGLLNNPDIAGLMNNPAIMNMASNFMKNPDMMNMFGSMMGRRDPPPQ